MKLSIMNYSMSLLFYATISIASQELSDNSGPITFIDLNTSESFSFSDDEDSGDELLFYEHKPQLRKSFSDSFLKPFGLLKILPPRAAVKNIKRLPCAALDALSISAVLIDVMVQNFIQHKHDVHRKNFELLMLSRENIYEQINNIDDMPLHNSFNSAGNSEGNSEGILKRKINNGLDTLNVLVGWHNSVINCWKAEKEYRHNE